ncbi:hypothetical protein ACIQLG_03900 [Terribacillus saccharophilus]|uniref:hypothetical protein n=1 Tax=Terribacillus saccharophilus TaxID=361277 RepID=UPI003806C5BC
MIVDIYVRVIQKDSQKHGIAFVIFNYKGRKKELYFTTLENTQNRSIILACSNSLLALKKSCIVNLHTQTNFGFKFMENTKKWVNRDAGVRLLKIINQGRHHINFIDYSASPEGRETQQLMNQKLIYIGGTLV